MNSAIWPIMKISQSFALLSAALALAACGAETPSEPTAGGAAAGCSTRAYAEIGGPFSLIDHTGQRVTEADFKGDPTLVFFGFTYCPDICPTTMAFLDRFVAELEGTEVEDTQVVMVSVDPARDTVEQLAQYVPFFNEDFIGVTGEFLDIHRFATALNTPFRKVPGQDENYLVDHSANVILINPRGDYHGFFKAPLDQAKMKLTYRSARVLWDR